MRVRVSMALGTVSLCAGVGGRRPVTPRPGVLVSMVAVLAVAGCAVAGCALPPKGPVRDPDARPPSPSAPGTSSSHRSVTPFTPTRTRTPSPTGFGTLVAVACNGKPTGGQVIALLRRTGVLPAQAQPTVTEGPLCAGTWQYTEVSRPDAEPIDVVTRGAPEALALVTAGTDACTAEVVRSAAPHGIRIALGCASNT